MILNSDMHLEHKPLTFQMIHQVKPTSLFFSKKQHHVKNEKLCHQRKKSKNSTKKIRLYMDFEKNPTYIFIYN